MTTGERLKKIRTMKERTLKEIAEIFDITVQTLSRYENNKRSPDLEFLQAFSQHFKLSCDWLLSGRSPIFFEDIKGSNSEKDVNQLWIEFSEKLLKQNNFTPSENAEKLPFQKMTQDTPNNYFTMLKYMMIYEGVRDDIFQFFYLFPKNRVDQLLLKSEKETDESNS